jgi:hypothetical protein
MVNDVEVAELTVTYTLLKKLTEDGNPVVTSKSPGAKLLIAVKVVVLVPMDHAVICTPSDLVNKAVIWVRDMPGFMMYVLGAPATLEPEAG